jgi:hypothetical protein
MADGVKVTVEGVQSKEDMLKLLEVVNQDIRDFEPYMTRVGGSPLTSWEAAVIRTYLVWKALDIKDEDITAVPN